MNIEDLQQLCNSLPAVTEDIKWEHDLCFCIGGKMFCVVGLNQTPTTASFKVLADEFEELSTRNGFKPAPYVARYKWVLAEDITNLSPAQWQQYVTQSYTLVRDKLPAKVRKELNI